MTHALTVLSYSLATMAGVCFLGGLAVLHGGKK